MIFSYAQQRYVDVQSHLSTMLTCQGLCRWSVHNNIHTRFERPRRPGINICRARHHFDEGLLCLRILVHIFDMFLKTVASRCILHHSVCAATVPAVSAELRNIHFCLEYSFNCRCRFPVSTPTTMGNDDSTMFQYCKYTTMAS
jgi:hypothetical protein